MATKVGVLEDDNLTRLTLAAALEAQGFEVLVASASAGDFLKVAQTRWLDAALLDVHLGAGPTGLDVAAALRKLQPNLGLVFLTSFEDPRLLDPKLPKPPANSRYLTKSEIRDIEMLRGEIELAIAGADRAAAESAGPLSSLSDTQIETLRMIALGLSNSEIAKRRFVTEKSVETTVSRIAKTLGIVQQSGKNQRVHIAQAYFRSRGMAIEDVE
jgi:DNA-binding NarL/FixJ family response regulator